MTGTKFQFVPYRGGGPLLAGSGRRPDRPNFGQAATSLGAVRNGQIKAIAVQAQERWSGAPDVPTIDEAGVPGLYGSVLARHVGAEGHAEGRDRQAQRRGDGCAGRSGGAAAVHRSRPGDRPREQQTPEALAAIKRPRSKVVADHQGLRHQGGMNRTRSSAGRHEPIDAFASHYVLAVLGGAQAQTLSVAPDHHGVALPAGGAVDALARVLAEHMRITLGQPIIVENMGGAGGTISIRASYARRPTATRSAWARSAST